MKPLYRGVTKCRVLPVSALLAFPSEQLCQNHSFPSTLLVHFLSPRLWLFFALLRHEVRKAD